MRRLVFFNNASFKLSQALTDSYDRVKVQIDRSRAAANLAMPDFSAGCYTIATILPAPSPGQTEPDASQAGVYEIILLREVTDEGDGTFSATVERGAGMTAPLVWPAGSLVECRVTENMLSLLRAAGLRSEYQDAASINKGDVFLDWSANSDYEAIRGAFALGGLPVAPASGPEEGPNADHFPKSRMATQVEGVGYSSMVELGVAAVYDPERIYLPGEFAMDAESLTVHAYNRGNAFATPQAALGDYPWSIFNANSYWNGAAFSCLDQYSVNPDIWFYPTEIGFICEEYSATAPPTITVKEMDGEASTLGELIAAQELTGIGARERRVLSNTVTKGIKGLKFELTAAAAGGLCRGRFYWKGLFICSNTFNGYPQEPSTTDGSEPIGVPM
ncbi:hypothetical protein COAQ111491_14080 [Comamonas aquatilis]|uniref:hypothetical protein n=1 Tax=Comamonas aquatilis TaxID=1778406 RepID=UPI0039EE1597